MNFENALREVGAQLEETFCQAAHISSDVFAKHRVEINHLEALLKSQENAINNIGKQLSSTMENVADHETLIGNLVNAVNQLKVTRDESQDPPGMSVLMAQWRKRALDAERDAGSFKEIRQDIPTICLRECYNCGSVSWHADSVGRYVKCQGCGSMDTRLVKEKTHDTDQ